MRKMYLLKNFFLMLIAVSVIISCDSTEPPGPPEKPAAIVNTGQFLDHAVAGLTYTTETQSGTTNNSGEFKYSEGEIIEFSVGSIKLGSAIAAAKLTPIDLVPDAIDYTDSTVVNILRLLQTLDEDNNPSNGIKINAEVVAAATSELDFTSSGADFESNLLVNSLLSAANKQQLVDTDSAIQHFRDTLLEIDATSKYLLGGQIFGLSGSLVLKTSNLSDLEINQNGAFQFSQPLLRGDTFSVTLSLEATSAQSCRVENGSGVIRNSDVTSVLVICGISQTSIVGNTTGLNFGNSYTLSTPSGFSQTVSNNGSFKFLADGVIEDLALLSVTTRQLTQQCRLTFSLGAVLVNCVDTKLISGNIAGLVGTIGISLNGASATQFTDVASYQFSDRIAIDNSYTVTITSEPPNLLCSFAGDLRTLSVLNQNVSIDITCIKNQFNVSANINNLLGSIDLQVNSAVPATTVTGTGFPQTITLNPVLTLGDAYTLAITRQSSVDICVFRENGLLTISKSINLLSNSIDLDCAPTYLIKVAVSGAPLTSNLMISNNIETPSDVLTIPALGSYQFGKRIRGNSAADYSFAVDLKPDNETCEFQAVQVSSTSNEILLPIICTSDTIQRYIVNGSIFGLRGTINLEVSSTDPIGTLTKSFTGTPTALLTDFTLYGFNTGLIDQSEYQVKITNQPLGQTCSIKDIASTDPTLSTPKIIDSTNAASLNVDIECVNDSLDIEVNISGLSGEIGAIVTVSATGVTTPPLTSFDGTNGALQQMILTPDAPALNHGGDYSVSITNPIGQNCRIDGAASPLTISRTNISADTTGTRSNTRIVNIRCSYYIDVNVAGYSETIETLDITLAAASSPTIPIGSTSLSAGQLTHRFNNANLNAGEGYIVSAVITNQPVGLVCNIDNSAQTISADPVTRVVNITCDYFVQVKVNGFTSPGKVLGIKIDAPSAITGTDTLSFSPSPIETIDSFTGILLDADAEYTVSINPIDVGQTCNVVDNGIAFPRRIVADVSSSRIVNIQCENFVKVNVTGLTTNAAALLIVSLNGDPTNKLEFSGLTTIPLGDLKEFSTTPLGNGAAFTVNIIDQPNEADWYCSITGATPATTTGVLSASEFSDTINGSSVSVNIQCLEKFSIVNLPTNIDPLIIVDPGLLNCIQSDPLGQAWEYILDVTEIDCSLPLATLPANPRRSVWGVNNPTIEFISIFKSLKFLDLGSNSLANISANFYQIKNPSQPNPNYLDQLRYINILDTDRFPEMKLQVTFSNLHVNNFSPTFDTGPNIRFAVPVDGVVFDNNGTPSTSGDDFVTDRININVEQPDNVIFFCSNKFDLALDACTCTPGSNTNFCDSVVFKVEGNMWGYDLQFFDVEINEQVCTPSVTRIENLNENGGTDSLPGGSTPISSPTNDQNYVVDFACVSSTPLEINSVTDANLKSCLTRAAQDNQWQTANEITSLNCSGLIQDLTGLEQFVSLDSLTISRPISENIEPLRALTNLTYLFFAGDGGASKSTVNDLIADGVFLGDPQLETCLATIGTSFVFDVVDLDCSNYASIDPAGIGITDLTGIERFYNLRTLNLNGNSIQDLSSIGRLTVHPLLVQSPLHTLNLANNNVIDISPLSGLPFLADVNLSGNSVTTSAMAALSIPTSVQRETGWMDDKTLPAGKRQRPYTLQVTTAELLLIGDTTIAGIPSITMTVSDLAGTVITPISGVYNLTEGLYNVLVEEVCGDCLGSVAITVSATGATPTTARFVSNIHALDLARNSLSDIAILNDLGNMNYLDLSDNGSLASEISIFQSLSNLKFLDLTSTVMLNGGLPLPAGDPLGLPGVNNGQDARTKPKVFSSAGIGGTKFLVPGSGSYSVSDTTEVILYPVGAAGNDLLPYITDVATGKIDLVIGKTVSSSFNVNLDMDTPNPNDYIVTLTTPSNKTITICNRNCARTGILGIKGNFPADFPLLDFSTIAGEPLEGTWTLFIDDQVVEAGDPGDALNSWAISN